MVVDAAAGAAPQTVTLIDVNQRAEVAGDAERRARILDRRVANVQAELRRNGIAPVAHRRVARSRLGRRRKPIRPANCRQSRWSSSPTIDGTRMRGGSGRAKDARRIGVRRARNGENRVNPIVVVLNGPNLNLLGKREPEIYGRETLADVEADCRRVGGELGLSIEFHQSNREYELIDWIHDARERAAGIVINPAAFTHTSVAILDALNAFEGPIIEVHISNVHKREAFRHHSYVSASPRASSSAAERKAIRSRCNGSRS